MMKMRWILILGLACSLLAAGCSSTDHNSGSTAETTAPEDTETADTVSDSVLKDGNIVELRMVFPGQNSSPASLAEIEAAMNEIIKDEIDAEVKLEILEWGVYDDQTNLMLSSGEDVSLMFCYSNIRNLAKSGKIQPITRLLDTYGQAALAEFTHYLPACEIDGEMYGLPSFFDYAAYAGLVCRADILGEFNVNPDEINNWDDIEDILIQVKEAYPNMNALTLPEYSGVFPYYNHGKFDEILPNSGVRIYASEYDNVEVVNYYATPEYRELAEKAYDWNQKGYFVPDATTVTDSRQEYIAAGNTFGYIGKVHPGTVTQESKNSGYEMTVLPVTDAVLSTNNVSFAQYTVPNGCKNPEKAVAFLNIFYSNPDMQNLMAYGIEGKDYIVKDQELNIVGYPDGVDESNVGWLNETWVCGNGKISYVWETDEPTIWEDYIALNESAIVSPVYGFVYDISNVKNEITAVENVINKYEGIVDSGYAEVDESLEQFNSELQAAGIQNIIDDAQAQIDAWLAAQ